MSSTDDCILFEHLVKLLNSISNVQPRRGDVLHPATNAPKSLDLVNQWFARVRKYYTIIPPHTCKIFFRLFFPEEDVRRRYNIKETTLARYLATDVFGLSTGMRGAGRTLTQWSEYPDTADKAKLGCLGAEVEKVLSDRHSVRHGISLNIQRIDDLLDELASLSGYSDLTDIPRQRPKRTRAAILRDLFLGLDPVEAKFLTQIILKDLRPVLYPLTETHTTRALLHYNSNALHVLTKWEVMKAWHSCMPRIYRARASLDEAANAVETLPSTGHAPRDHKAFLPLVGVPVEIPKSRKGTKLSHALSFFRGAGEVWAETKYDGERMQIHIDLSKPASQQIVIFSKSKRNSTQDRMGTHPIIRAALGLPSRAMDGVQYPALVGCVSMPSVRSSVVLDAEMVCYSESKGAVDEFWRIRSLIESTAHGIRGAGYHAKNLASAPESQDSRESGHENSQDVIMESLQSNASDNGDRHLKLVFFDLLFFDGSSLLDQTYLERRAQLERLIHIIPGFVELSWREAISLSHGLPAAVQHLGQIFSEHIANHQEGVVLKASESTYCSHSHPWVKLKRDYIPGYGDTVDLVILGAGWNKERARELRVAPETFTTFFVGALEKPKPGSDVAHCMPQFQVLFTVEYGMGREELETFNFYVKTSGLHAFREEMQGLPYRFLLPRGSVKPAFMFSRPLLGELFGAGFTKDAGAKFYSLRFPRITKVWRANERNWAQGSHLEDFQSIARSSIGRESGAEWANRTVDAMWGGDADGGPKDLCRIADTANHWKDKLLSLEGLDVGTTGRTVRPINVRNRDETSSARRKSAPHTFQEPSSKRRKLQIGRMTAQPLKALVSMTNITLNDTRVQGQKHSETTKLSPPITPTVLSKDQTVQHEVKEDKGVGVIQVTTRDTLMTPVSLKRASTSQKTTALVSPPAPTMPLRNLPPHAAQLQASESSSQEIENILTQPPPARELQTRTSPSPTSPERRHAEKGNDLAPALFPEHYWPQDYVHTSIVQFLQNAYVWIPRDADNKRPVDRPRATRLIPQNRRIGVIYFLLIICGCRVEVGERVYQSTSDQFAHVDKCVLFVKTGEEPELRQGLSWLFGALESWRTELNETGNKELFVFDSNMITFGSLATFSGDVASQALWRSSRKFEGTSV